MWPGNTTDVTTLLPIVESAYDPFAYSHGRASGMWQFIPSTGYKFGLSRDKFIDQRMDPEKSTRAAIEYLKEAIEKDESSLYLKEELALLYYQQKKYEKAGTHEQALKQRCARSRKSGAKPVDAS